MNFGGRPFLYGEGHAHREAADLVEQEESCEEVAALFAVLPFHDVDSESDRSQQDGGDMERDEGVVVELSQTGPYTRRLKPPIMTIGMSVGLDVVVMNNPLPIS